jgi:hypothetical protein
MTISGESARRDRCTASETFCVRLTARISFVANDEKASTALVTCSASSRVGTRIRADVHWVEEVVCEG